MPSNLNGTVIVQTNSHARRCTHHLCKLFQAKEGFYVKQHYKHIQTQQRFLEVSEPVST